MGEVTQQEFSNGGSRVIQQDLYVPEGTNDENGVSVMLRRWRAVHRYSTQRRYHYSKRFSIGLSYRLSEQAIATTTTRDAMVRFLYVVVSLLL
jgi:hypothetical protein